MKKNDLRIVCPVLILLILCTGNAESQTLRYFQTDHRYAYRIELLRLVMDKTLAEYGPYAMEPYPNDISHKRGLTYLERGILFNIGFFPSNRERESKLLSVKIPILRGLLGYRVFLIRKESLKEFSDIHSLPHLKDKFKAGFGDQWADMAILRFNHIPVVGTATYENLFNMLSKKRFDYFPRGINEAWTEIARRKQRHPDLTVAPGLAFYYPYPVYFFVNKTDEALAARIARGLNAAIEDGTFKTLFLKYHREMIHQADLKNRTIFTLKNPTLAEGISEPDTGWWMDKNQRSY